MGIGKSDKIPEENGSFSHHTQNSFTIGSLGQFWAVTAYLMYESCMHVRLLYCWASIVQNWLNETIIL